MCFNKYDHIGHAVMRLNQLKSADKSENAWYLLPYQLSQGFPAIISSHILKGIELAKSDKQSLLIFSGGQTRKDVGPTSEAASYFYLAQEKKWDTFIANQIYLEEFARDSFENLLFSICRFKEIQGEYPSKVTVVGFDFKSDRFTYLHRKAIKYPESNFTYVGLKPSDYRFDYSKSVNGESMAIQSFKQDMYGCNDITLKQKRETRNPFKRSIPYELACPEIKNLLNWCGPDIIPDKLPWEV